MPVGDPDFHMPDLRSRGAGSGPDAGVRLLVVDDEPRILDFLRRALVAHGYEVDTVADGRDALRALGEHDYDLVLLDLMMPGVDGLAVLRELNEGGGGPPILVLSARSDVHVKVSCLELGAADYLTKPFALVELVARIRTRVRAADAARIVRRAGISLDVSRRLADVGNGPVRLSEREFALLERLLRSHGEVCTREELLIDVWGLALDPGTNVVDVCVRRLRAKLGAGLIETARNVGYRLRAAHAAA